jgi:hypothetical protein
MIFYCTAGVFADQSVKFFMRVVSFWAGANLNGSPRGLNARVGDAFFASSVFSLMEYLVRYGHLSKCCRERCHNLGENWGDKGKARCVAFLAGAVTSFLSEGVRESLFPPSQGNSLAWTKTFATALPFLIATEVIAYCASRCESPNEASENRVSAESSSINQSALLSQIQSAESDVTYYSQFEGSEVITTESIDSENRD